MKILILLFVLGKLAESDTRHRNDPPNDSNTTTTTSGIPPKDFSPEQNVTTDELAGTTIAPQCATQNNRHYCSYKENYPTEMVDRIVRFYKFPLENIFKDLNRQVMPTLALDSGGVVCTSVTQLIRPGWAMNTNRRWVVVINHQEYRQFITEIICRYGNGAGCNYVPPCFRAKCLQRYNTQKLLAIDPNSPFRGPFLTEFLFPSCCVCHIENDPKSFESR